MKRSRYEKNGGYYAMNNSDLLHTRVLQYRAKLEALTDEEAWMVERASERTRPAVRERYQRKREALEKRYTRFIRIALDEMERNIVLKKASVMQAEDVLEALQGTMRGILDSDQGNRWSFPELVRTESRRKKTSEQKVLGDKYTFFRLACRKALTPKKFEAFCSVVDDFESIK